MDNKEIEYIVSKQVALDILREYMKNTIYTFNIEGKPIISIKPQWVLDIAKKYGVLKELNKDESI